MVGYFGEYFRLNIWKKSWSCSLVFETGTWTFSIIRSKALLRSALGPFLWSLIAQKRPWNGWTVTETFNNQKLFILNMINRKVCKITFSRFVSSMKTYHEFLVEFKVKSRPMSVVYFEINAVSFLNAWAWFLTQRYTGRPPC
jgi:hypothetical protein